MSLAEKNNSVRSDILFDFYEYVFSRWAYCPTLAYTFHYGSSSFRDPKFDILYHDMSFKVVHLKLHIFSAKRTLIHDLQE